MRRDKKLTLFSIHSDDYDRVMKAYQEAFQSRRQLRTVGQTSAWTINSLTSNAGVSCERRKW